MSMWSDPASAETLAAIATVQRQLSDAVERLRDASDRSASVAAQTDWRTDAALAFHATAEAWRADVAMLPGAVESARDDVGVVRARIANEVWGLGG